MYCRRIALLFGFFVANIALAHPPAFKNDPQRPVGNISRDLGITQDAFVTCFNNVNPTPDGARPEARERVQSNKKVLLSCLKRFDSEITNDSLDAVMDRYRPDGRGREAQEPMH
jgi:hypothetical protein